MARTFEHSVAIRRRMWLRIGIAGPTGAGKSMSAQQLALGFSIVDPASVWLVNTEGANGLLYAPKPGQKATPPTTFDFTHLQFDPPHRTPDYLAAVQYAVAHGGRHIIIDGGHFEHEAYLAYHEAEVTRLVGKNDTYERREKMAMTGWIKPSAERHAALLAFRLIEANIIWCFQGKEKIHMKKRAEMQDGGDKMVELGWQPIAGAEVVAELPIRFLLPPGCDGVPNLRPDLPGEKLFSRVPIELRQPGFLTAGRALDVELGKKLQQWAMPGEVKVADLVQMRAQGATALDRTATLTEIKSLLSNLAGQDAKKSAVANAFNCPWPKVEKLPDDALSAGLARLRLALRSAPPPEPPQVPDDGNHRERIAAYAQKVGLPVDQIAAVIGGPLDDLPADLETMAIAKISEWSDEKGVPQ